MANEGSVIDISVLEALIDLRKQQALVDQYCQRAEERKDKVEPAVYARVVADYARRRQALEEQAAPLVTKAIGEYRKLRATYTSVQATHDAARLDKQEVEFRHSLGEIDDEAMAERLKGPEEVLARTAEELAALDSQESLFRTALPNVDLAEIAAAAETPPVPEEQAAADATAVPPPIPATDLEATPIAAAPDDAIEFAEVSDATLVEMAGDSAASGSLAGPHNGVPSAAPVPPPVPPPLPEGEGSEDRTFIVPEASLISEADNGKTVNFRLSALTYIGRSEDNQLRLLDPGVSRRHVLIMAGPGGYTIRDLGSQNGTYVNGDRVDEGPLTDGDRITIGEINLLFRSQPLR
ncbi:MAG TPA: FHA domain-containing protein [Vicinamibacterales bacterium]